MNMSFVAKLYGVLKVGQDLLAILVPALEVILKRDINGDGKVG